MSYKCLACGWVNEVYDVPHMPPERPIIGDRYHHHFDPTFKWRRPLPDICYGMMKAI